ncbi:outer membrane assembly lipoprotein YfiO [Candidatus Magnetoovum chiemensis]|nr:outer membrane assembly lipoprotein YfiO [Candidatus Magnetoovum chiemensis]
MLKINYIKLLALLLITVPLWACSKKHVKPTYTTPKETYEASLNLLKKNNYEEARELLTSITNRDDTKTYAPLAQLKLAESYDKDEDYDIAITEYRKFVKLYPDSKYAPYAQYQVASIYFKQIEGPAKGYRYAEDARREFQKLKELFPRNPYREVIELRIQKCNNILAAHERYVGEFYYKSKSYNSALLRFNVILDKYKSYDKTADIYYMMAECYKGLGDNKKAAEFYNKALELSSNERKLNKKIQKGIKHIEKN